MKNFNLVSINKFANAPPAVFLDTIESVRWLLEQCGARVFTSTNRILIGATNIIFGAGTHFSHDFATLSRNLPTDSCVIFNMEQLSSDSDLVNDDYIGFLKKYKVLDYNQNNVALACKLGVARAFEFPLVPSPNFASDYGAKPSFTCTYDLGFYGALNVRRRNLLNSIQFNGIQIKHIHGAYGPELSRQLTDCTAVLNLHYYESAVFEVARCLRPLSMGIPVISERSLLPASVDWRYSGVCFVDADKLISKIQKLLSNKEGLLVAHRQIRHFMQTDYSAELRRVLEFLGQ